MIQLLTGENTYEIRARRARIIDEFRGTRGKNAVTIADGSTLQRNDLPQLLLGGNLFAPERLVIIDEANATKDIWDTFIDYLPDASDVLLVAPTADKRTKTYKWLQKNAEIITTSHLSDSALVAWVQTIGRDKGIDIPPSIARYLIEYTTGDQWQLHNDIEKLALSEAPITNELIRELLIPNPLSSAFDLLDAALSGNKRRVNQLLEGVRTHEDPYRFFGLLSSQVFAIIVCACAGTRSAETIVTDSGIHPYVVRKTLPVARKLTVRKRNYLAEVVATTDMQLKTSGADPWVLITALLKTIAA